MKSLWIPSQGARSAPLRLTGYNRKAYPPKFKIKMRLAVIGYIKLSAPAGASFNMRPQAMLSKGGGLGAAPNITPPPEKVWTMWTTCAWPAHVGRSTRTPKAYRLGALGAWAWVPPGRGRPPPGVGGRRWATSGCPGCRPASRRLPAGEAARRRRKIFRPLHFQVASIRRVYMHVFKIDVHG